ncbi:hypothetical protein ACFXJ5_34950 [Streptomyces sp. NPDC059373]
MTGERELLPVDVPRAAVPPFGRAQRWVWAGRCWRTGCRRPGCRRPWRPARACTHRLALEADDAGVGWVRETFTSNGSVAMPVDRLARLALPGLIPPASAAGGVGRAGRAGAA